MTPALKRSPQDKNKNKPNGKTDEVWSWHLLLLRSQPATHAVRSQPYLLLEGLSLPGYQGICFADDRDDIDLLMHCPEEGHI